MPERAAVHGVGESEYSRGTELSEAALTVIAARRACADAGIAPQDIDGVVIPGARQVRVEDLVSGLGINDLSFTAKTELGGASSVAAIGLACTAVESGRASRVLIAGGWRGYSDRRIGGGGDTLLENLARVFPAPLIRRELEHPYGLIAPLQYYALQANRWMAEFDISREALATVALTSRQNAQLNPKAVMRGKELSAEDYAGAPVISEPFRKFDCCLETDGAAAVVIGLGARGGRDVLVLGAAEGRPNSPEDITNRPDLLELGIARAAQRAFDAAALGPDEVDVWAIYDCFTFVVLRQIEEMGICSRGESPQLIKEKGIGIADGMPINPHGGLLSEAHVLGLNHVVEAVRQVRGECGERQVSGARTAAVTGYGDFGDGAIAILGKAA
jgi:acetyl-CoA acetyltransferase